MVKVTQATSASVIRANCSKCTRPNNTPFKCCLHCRLAIRKYHKKRLRPKPCPDGFRQCGKCGDVKPIDDFKSKHSRRNTPTKHCSSCRNIDRKSQVNPTTKSGRCKALWEAWKSAHPCEDCGETDTRLIEADHVRGKKVHNCSHYCWWACHGGVSALTEELTTCQSRCIWCHRIKTKQTRGANKQKSKLKKRAIVHAEKMRRGECLRCRVKVTDETAFLFDFDHREHERKVKGICYMVTTFPLERFHSCIDNEMEKCDLLCCKCHKRKTLEEHN